MFTPYARAIGARYVTVITGRGLHSAGGVARIKPAVEEFLQQHRFEYIPLQAGCFRITIPQP